MRACCVICSDLFDDVQPVVATRCGHAFHSACLSRWTDQSRTCPECRARIPHSAPPLRLYFSHTAGPDPGAAAENEIGTLRASLGERDAQIERLRRDADSLRVIAREAEERAEVLHQTRLRLEAEADVAALRLKAAASLEMRLQRQEMKNRALGGELEQLRRVRAVVEGAQGEVQDVLEGLGDKGAAKELATHVVLLKRELHSALDAKTKLKMELGAAQRDLGIGRTQLQQARKEIRQLEEQLAEKENLDVTPKCLMQSPLPPPKGKDDSLTCVMTPISEQTLADVVNKRKFEVVCESKMKVIARNSPVMLERPLLHTVRERVSGSESIVRIGYNGLGGHANFVGRSTPVKHKMLKKKN